MYVHVNAAVSVDGKLSSRRREQIRISESADFARVDRLRARADAIVVGVGTVLADDPSLTRYDEQVRRERNPTGVAPPVRIVVDSRCRTPTDAEILSGDPKTIVLTSRSAPTDRRDALEDAGATVLVRGGKRVDLVDGFAALADEDVKSLLVEGGGELIYSLFEYELVDELSVYVGPLVIGGRGAPTLADGEGFVSGFPRLELTDVERLDEGIVLTWIPDELK